jgi:protein arginine kinase activator
MVCQICKKNPATVRYIEVQDKQSTEVHLCQGCAEDKGITVKLTSKQGWPAEMLAKLVDDVAGGEEAKVGPVQCEHCGMLYSAFKENGRLGCAECYSSFKERLRPLLRRIHGNTSHTGKNPARDAAGVAHSRQVRQLEEELQQAIDGEEFERAADLRDRIRELEVVKPEESSPEPKGE